MTDKVYTYYYRNRPPGIGCQPDGFDPDTRETWVPRKEVQTPVCPWPFWGKVQYTRALPPHKVYEFELWPADELQWAIYKAWEEIQDHGDLWVLESYEEALKADANRPDLQNDISTIIIKILWKNGITISELETHLNY